MLRNPLFSREIWRGGPDELFSSSIDGGASPLLV